MAGQENSSPEEKGKPLLPEDRTEEETEQPLPPDPRGLRTGYTTGACAAAATKAALLSLLRQEAVQKAEIQLPVGRKVWFETVDGSFSPLQARYGVVKDGGDDPDATHGAVIYSSVAWCKVPGFLLDGGEGVGRVTKPGLGLEVGGPAINPVPRQMIRQVVEEILGEELRHRGVSVVISVPDGEVIAQKTLNPRLGILGGISILGTTGIVRPFSTAAYKASVVQAVQVAAANGCRTVVLTTGGRSEKYAMKLYPSLSEEAFVEMGDYLGHALRAIQKAEVIEKVCLVGMMGKFSKAASGHMQLHARESQVDFSFLARLAERAGSPQDLVREVSRGNTANQVAEWMTNGGYTRFFSLLAEEVVHQVQRYLKMPLAVEVTLVSLQGQVLGAAPFSVGRDPLF